ncbi:hypothetical protein [Pseudofrankia sp. BMG5.36]|uniref:hypothetical protein n=1 Tax=Pseudofrankia sp. BMG5.36 TaxID=1834512 RepID=UPI0018E2FEA7|nr:hypothetical protein [Pseudofrankia sp. BMG5.36]
MEAPNWEMENERRQREVTGRATGTVQEMVELLPDRTTLAAVEIGRKEFDPTNFPVGSPWSSNGAIDAHAESQVNGGFMPIVLTLAPSINIIVQKSDLDFLDFLGFGHHADDGSTADPKVGDGLDKG